MADPKKEPEFEALIRKLNAAQSSVYSVERAPYPHPKTGRKMVEFHLSRRDADQEFGSSVFATKDYNRVCEVIYAFINVAEAGGMR